MKKIILLLSLFLLFTVQAADGSAERGAKRLKFDSSLAAAAEVEALECSVCLEEIEAGSEHKLANCTHVFHMEPCLTAWGAKGRLSCPLCRAEVDPTKMPGFKRSIKDLIELEEDPEIVGGRLDLSHCFLTDLDGFKDLENWQTIRQFIVSNNLLKTIPVGIFSGCSFHELDLSNNELERIDEDAFGDMVKLENLNLGHNKLTAVPVLCAIPSLQYLTLSENKITVLPPNICSLNPDITYLDITNNEIDEVDDHAFDSLPNLAVLDLTHNLLSPAHKSTIADRVESDTCQVFLIADDEELSGDDHL